MPTPPQLAAYHLERRFHERFGVPFPPLREWPARKLSDYTVIMQVEAELEAEQQRGTASGAGGPAGHRQSAEVTEAAFQQMRAAAQPPPMPPGANPPYGG